MVSEFGLYNNYFCFNNHSLVLGWKTQQSFGGREWSPHTHTHTHTYIKGIGSERSDAAGFLQSLLEPKNDIMHSRECGSEFKLRPWFAPLKMNDLRGTSISEECAAVKLCFGLKGSYHEESNLPWSSEKRVCCLKNILKLSELKTSSPVKKKKK